MVHDLRHLAPEQREAQTQTLILDETSAPFDLQSGPLIRGSLLRLAEREHILLLTMHHIVSDGWSLGILVQEVAALYAHHAHGIAPSLAALPMRYVDFAKWQRQSLAGEVLAQQLDYWKQQLAGSPELLPLPTDRPRPPVQSQRGASLPYVIPAKLGNALRALSRTVQSSLFMTLTAAFNILLARYTGQKDLCIGTPIANRHRAETEGLIGLFVNTLVLRTHVDMNQGFAELLKQVRTNTLDAYAYQDVQFEQLIEALQLERHASYSPLFQVMLVLQNAPTGELALPGLSMNLLESKSVTAKFDVTLTLVDDKEGMHGTFEYSTDLFEASTIERMADHFSRLLQAIVADPNCAVGKLAMLGDVERRRLLHTLNDTTTVYPDIQPDTQTLQQLFEAQVARTPDHVAVMFEGLSLSYTQLNARANRLARHLRSFGVGPDVLVGLCVKRSVEMIVGLLGVLKAGGAYVPLDPAYPQERLATILADAMPALVLTQQDLQEQMPALPGVAVFCLDADAAALSTYAQDNLRHHTQPHHLAYVIYTSGSTGKPKGVMVPHGSVLNYVGHALRAYLSETIAGSVVSSPLGFDATVTTVLPPLLIGKPVMLLADDEHTLTQLSARLFAAGAAWLFKITPAHLEALSYLGDAAAVDDAGVTGDAAHCIVVGGEQLSLATLRRWKGTLLPTATFINEYGPTEATVGCSVWTLSDAAALDALHGVGAPIGRPIGNTQLYVLGEGMQLQAQGCAGELYIGGEGLARGYLNRAELTTERFVTDPFSAKAGARLYRTGDLVRYRADGELEFLGRSDGQVKIRGFRIELGEVESVLAALPSVRDVVVVARPDERNLPQLVAYLVMHDGQSLRDVASLRTALLCTLPDYMVPEYFVPLDELPLTANGKVDRKALPAPDMTRGEAGYAAPRTPAETIMTELWAEMFKLDRVGIHDDFFALGGHSLLATQLVSRIKSALQIDLPLRSLFDAPTISALMLKMGYEVTETEIAAPQPASQDLHLPLSFGQTRLWFMDQFERHSAAYNIPITLRMQGALHREALARALNDVVDRHDALRAYFESVDGIPVQRIRPGLEWTLVHHDLRDAAQHERDVTTQTLILDETRIPFDLQTGPLIRGSLLHLAEQEYLLLLTMHHIVSDGWSMGILVQEVAALYASYAQGHLPSLPPLPMRYVDFASAQRQWLSDEVLAPQLDYWKQQLAGSPELLMLPTDRPRPPVQSQRGASLPYVIPAELSARLKALSRTVQGSLFMTLSAAFNILLARYTGQSDICIGTPIANRHRAETEGLIGLFINTLVLRTQVDLDCGFIDLLKQVRMNMLDAYAHQDVQFEQLIELLQPERHPSYTPLFQVMLVLQNAPMDKLALPGLQLELVSSASTTAKFDLTLTLTETEDGLHGDIEYSTDLFDAATIERMAAHLSRLLRAIVIEPQRAVGDLDMLGASEHRMLRECNDTAVSFTHANVHAPTIHQLFEAQVIRTPAHDAVVHNGVVLSYTQLNEQANRLAHRLRSIGVRPDDRVAICAERSVDMLIAMLATLKAGGAYVPLDPAYPLERLAYMLKDSEPVALLTCLSDSHRVRLDELLRAELVPTLDVHANAVDLASERADNPDPGTSGLSSRSLAYVIYTSGSTGQPKGVMVEHATVTNLMRNHVDQCVLVDADRVLQFASFAFDSSIEEIFAPLMVGATVVMRPADMVAPDDTFRQFLRDMRITVAELPTAFWQHWAQHEAGRGDIGDTLRLVVVGGEKAERRYVEQWFHSMRDQEAWLNTYGPTEATVYATAWMLDKARALPVGEIPIGRPIANAQIHILDARREPVPIGVTGEIYIGGAGIARGYLNRPQLTAERFVPDPFSQSADARLYKSGDLARYLPDGNIEFLGRNDFQVKIRGFRIELGEIEAKLAAIDGISAAAVVARDAHAGDKHLVAYIVAREGYRPDAETLRANLAESLAAYMLPSAYVTLPALPVNVNGKLDLKALPLPDLTHNQATYVAPRTPAEEIMAGIWADILKLDKVGIHDDFFVVGGHSLLATQLMSRIKRVLQVELPLRALFEAPTISALMLKLNQGDADIGALPLLPVSRHAPLPLSFGQMRLWFLDQLDHANTLYNMPSAIRLTGQLDVQAVTRTLNEIVRRHEVLRTHFVDDGTGPTQVILPSLEWPLVIHDLAELSVEERATRTKQLVDEQAQTLFDLASGPLVRSALLRLGQQEHVLLFTMHHIVSDGWSMNIVVREMAALYAAYKDNLPSPLPALPIQYADFAHWQREWLSGEVLEQQLAYWKQQLSGSPSLLALPTDRPRPPQPSHRGATQWFALPSTLVSALQTLGLQTQSTLFMTLCAAFNVLLARYSGQSDLCIGTPIANRNRSEIEELIGFFVNTLVLRTQVDLTGDFNALLQQVRQHTLDAYAHQDVPFEQLVEVLQPERHASYSPLFQVMLVLQNTPVDELALPGLSMSVLESESVNAKFDLTLNLADDQEGMQGCFEYSTDLFEARTIERMANHFIRLLHAIVVDPGCAVGELAMLTESERHTLLGTFNDTATVYPNIQPDTQTLQRLFEAQVARTPDDVAVMVEGVSLSYAQLNAHANRLARHLRTLGVGPDVLVGLCVERSAEMIVGLLAVLKAGGGYVPLDPAYPQERLATILSDAMPAVVLTRQHLQEHLPTLPGVTVLCFEQAVDVLSSYGDDDLQHRTQPHHIAYVIYTSGSTGKPKGVMVSHRALLNYAGHAIHDYLDEAISGSVVSSPLGFDATVTTVLPPLLVGKPVVLLADNEQTLTQLSARLFAPGAPWLFKITPAHLEALAYLSEAEAVDDTGIGGQAAHCIVVGGEQLSLATLRRWKGTLLPAATFVNEYGPTETTVGCSVWKLSDAAVLDTIDGVAAPIGRPIGNTQLYVLGESMQLQAQGCVGELYIGGVGVARGYLNRAELTMERFVTDPFSTEAGARLYRTGDLVRYRADGELEFLGRGDGQVKLRGFRIELGEIEQQLTTQANVQAATVMLREDSPGEKRLVAYLVPTQTAPEPEQEAALMAECRAALAQQLPDYMVPGAYVVLQALPLTLNGKVNHKALPAPDAMQSATMYVAPCTETEYVIAAIWSEILKVERVSALDDFFKLGGHSLLAVHMVSQLRARASIQMELRHLFAHPTLRAFATFIDANRTASQYSNLVPIRPHGQLAPLFLIHPIGGEVQYAFDLARHLDADRPVYALAASGIAIGETPSASIFEMATVYLQAMRQVQPAGPYKIAGWSLGGMIAYEIAHQLLEVGEVVDFIGMIDTGSRSFLRAQLSAEQPEFDDGMALLNWIVDLNPEVADARQHPAYGELMGLMASKDVDAMLAVCQREALLPAQLDRALARQMLAVYRAGAHAAQTYEAPAAKVRVTFFAADRHEGDDPVLGWGELLGERVDLIKIGGSHLSIVKPPHIEKLAREIARRITSHSSRTELSFA